MATHLANEETTEKKMRNNFSIDKARSNKVCTKEEEEKKKENNSIINQLLCPIRMTCKWQAREALCETHESNLIGC
jgi:hypothetical protein